MINTIISILTGSWKTTLIGLLSAVCLFLLPILKSGRMPNSQEILMAIVVAFLGCFAKDHDVTGTTKNKTTDSNPVKDIDHGAS